MREDLIRPLGLITQPNKMGQYPAGALAVADDCYMRDGGVIEFSRARSIFKSAASGIVVSNVLIPSNIELLQIVNNGGTTVGSWFHRWFSFGAGSTFDSSSFSFSNSGFCNWTRSRNRFLVTSLNTPVIFDFAQPTTTAERAPRETALPAPVLTGHAFTGTGNALLAGTHCTVVAVIKRTYADNYEIRSAVSNPVDPGYDNTNPCDLQYAVLLGTLTVAAYQAGDVIEVYRTRAQASPPANNIGGTSCDSTFYLTTTHTLTAGEITGANATFNDTTPDTGFGEALYTNPGAGGAAATHISPPQANVTCTFKGYTFLFNITEAAQLQLQTLSGMGFARVSPTDPVGWRQNMVGSRQIAGTATSGVRSVTAVSAADLVGIRVGQVIYVGTGSGFVSAVGASSITYTGGTAPTSSGAVTALAYDVLVIDSTNCYYDHSPQSMASIDSLSFYLNNSHTNDVIQAASLAYSSSTRPCEPTPISFTVSKARAIPVSPAQPNISFTATNGQNYQPALPEFGSTALVVRPTAEPNGYAWCEEQQPDHWPPANRGRIGSGDIYAAAATRDAIWIFASDGLWRLSGNGGSVGAEGYDWRVDPVDSTLSISGPQAVAVLRDTVYAYTNRGLVAIDDNGVDDTLSQGLINDLLFGPFYSQDANFKVRVDEEHDEVWVIQGGSLYIWNFQNKAWTRSLQMAQETTATYAFFRPVLAMIAFNDFTEEARWLDPAGTTWAVPHIQYQPTYLQDAFSTKQWRDVTYVFDPAPGDTLPFVQASFNGSVRDIGGTPKLNSTDARITVMVPRNSPAVAQSLSPGFQTAPPSTGNIPVRFWGISLRANVIGEQQTKRIR